MALKGYDLGRLAWLVGFFVGFGIEQVLWQIERRRHPAARLNVTENAIEFDDGTVHEVMPRGTKLEVRVFDGQHQVIAHRPGRVVVLRDTFQPSSKR